MPKATRDALPEPGAALPSAESIVEREARERPFAVWTAVALATVTAVAILVDALLARSVPDTQATTLIDTFGAVSTGSPIPSSATAAVARWRLDNVPASALVGALRSVAYLLAVPLVLLLMRAARDRGMPVPRYLGPVLVLGAVVTAAATTLVTVAQIDLFEQARDAGLTPGAIRDAVAGSTVVKVMRYVLFAGPLLLGVAIAFSSLHAFRAGLFGVRGIRPAALGYGGVFIGILSVVPLERSFGVPEGLLTAIWFSTAAFVVAGRTGDGRPEAWDAGRAIALVPREPPPPRKSGPGKS